MDIGLGHAAATLESRFTDLDTPVLLSGIQALAARSAGTGPAGPRRPGSTPAAWSPAIAARRWAAWIGRLWHRQALLAAQNIRFQPGVNEDLAATMLYGTQQTRRLPRQARRWRVRHVVRQGPRRRSRGRRAALRQFHRHRAAWRRAGGGRRRPRRAFLHLSAPDRACLPGRVHPGAATPPRSQTSSTSAWPASRCRASPDFGLR